MFNMKSLLFLLLSFQHLYSIQLQKEFLKTEGFTLKLPSDWIEIPNQILNENLEQSRIFLNQEKSAKFNYAFQLSSSEYWFKLPYILIDVDNSVGSQSQNLVKFKILIINLKKVLTIFLNHLTQLCMI